MVECMSGCWNVMCALICSSCLVLVLVVVVGLIPSCLVVCYSSIGLLIGLVVVIVSSICVFVGSCSSWCMKLFFSWCERCIVFGSL